jgi:hypothetical protein
MAQDTVSPVAARVIEKCGGVANTARLARRAVPSVHKWRHPKSKGGTGGLIPADAQASLMAAARRGEAALEPEDFFDAPVPSQGEDAA